MIIKCNNCHKVFEIDSGLISEKGRLLQCNGCDYKWFFKKEIIGDPPTLVKIIKPAEETTFPQKREESLEVDNLETMELLDVSFNDKTRIKKKENFDNDLTISTNKNRNYYKVLSLTIVFIISFISLIIVLDTLLIPVSKIIPNTEFLLYNLYETINDIQLFIKDLI